MSARAAVIRWMLISLPLFGLGFLISNFIIQQSRPIVMDESMPIDDGVWLVSTALPTKRGLSNPVKPSIQRYRISSSKDKKVISPINRSSKKNIFPL